MPGVFMEKFGAVIIGLVFFLPQRNNKNVSDMGKTKLLINKSKYTSFSPERRC